MAIDGPTKAVPTKLLITIHRRERKVFVPGLAGPPSLSFFLCSLPNFASLGPPFLWPFRPPLGPARPPLPPGWVGGSFVPPSVWGGGGGLTVDRWGLPKIRGANKDRGTRAVGNLGDRKWPSIWAIRVTLVEVIERLEEEGFL